MTTPSVPKSAASIFKDGAIPSLSTVADERTAANKIGFRQRHYVFQRQGIVGLLVGLVPVETNDLLSVQLIKTVTGSRQHHSRSENTNEVRLTWAPLPPGSDCPTCPIRRVCIRQLPATLLLIVSPYVSVS